MYGRRVPFSKYPPRTLLSPAIVKAWFRLNYCRPATAEGQGWKRKSLLFCLGSFFPLIGCFGLLCFLASYLKDKYKVRQLNASRSSANFSGYCLFTAVPDMKKKDQEGLHLPVSFPQHKVDFSDKGLEMSLEAGLALPYRIPVLPSPYW